MYLHVNCRIWNVFCKAWISEMRLTGFTTGLLLLLLLIPLAWAQPDANLERIR